MCIYIIGVGIHGKQFIRKRDRFVPICSRWYFIRVFIIYRSSSRNFAILNIDRLWSPPWRNLIIFPSANNFVTRYTEKLEHVDPIFFLRIICVSSECRRHMLKVLQESIIENDRSSFFAQRARIVIWKINDGKIWYTNTDQKSYRIVLLISILY